MQLSYQLKIELNNLPPALNKTLRQHWRRQRMEGKKWDNQMAFLLLRKLPPSPLKRAHIKITRHFWRTLDFDGLVGSLKPVVDSLVTCGVLSDDSWKVLQAWEVDQVFRPKKAGPLLQIEITEL